MYMSTGIGQRIKQRREELRLTQTELASRMGYKGKSAICKVETGEDNITSDRVEKFASALDCTVSFLMGWKEPDYIVNNDDTSILIEKFKQADNTTQEIVRKILGML